MFNTLELINRIFMTILSIFYFNQIFNLILSIFTKKKKYPNTTNFHNFAYLICARNEENVIGHLINSINSQDYPKEKIKIFVVSDNSTDRTKEEASSLKAIVFERNDNKKVGKSYAMDFGIKKILSDYRDEIDGIIILDADNLLDKSFTKEMNKAYDYQKKNSKTLIITGYKYPKNFKSSWISGGGGYLLHRESAQMHHTRSVLGNGTYVSGTGYLIDINILEEYNGWPFHTLVEDIEFSTDVVIHNEKVAFCEDAIYYDEQPTNLKYSWRQRIRWCKGTHQVFNKYSFKLIKSLIKKPSATKWGMFVHIAPLPALTFIWILLYIIIGLIYSLVTKTDLNIYYSDCLYYALIDVIASIIISFIIGFVSMLEAWKKIDASPFKKILYVILFPAFMFLYLPITTISLFINVKWKEIKHSNYFDKKQI